MRRLFPWPGELEVRDELVAERTRRRQLDQEVARIRCELNESRRRCAGQCSGIVKADVAVISMLGDDFFCRPPDNEQTMALMTSKANTPERLRQLLLEIYVSSSLMPIGATRAEHERLLDIVLAASEGREFEDLGLPYPRRTP